MTNARNISKTEFGLFYGFAAASVASVLAAYQLETTFLLAVPALLLIIFFKILNYKAMYFALMFLLPCSIEYYFPNGLATDLPTEPLMVGLTLVTLTILAFRKNLLPKGFISNPLILILTLHLFWILICAINSELPVFSFKVFAAKIWYFVPFTLLTAIILRTRRDMQRWFWLIFSPLTILIIVSVLRHGIIYQFSFSDVNRCVTPYFRNHVNYAAMISIFFPFVVWAASWYAKGTFTHKILIASIVLYIIATYLSYTRTAMLAIIGMIPFYYMVEWRMTRVAMAVFAVIAVIGVSWLFYDNHYLRFAPNYQETIYHDDFSSHLTSTFQGKDVSSMERVYRWVAGARMANDRPWMGVGSGNFYNFYRSYTVTEFETYISDNEEHSTVHNYYLLMLSEQGWPGLFIFVLITFVTFIYGEYIYYKMKSREDKRAVMTLLLVMFSIIINLILSDMLESDKVGPFFFMVLAMLALFDTGALSMETDRQ
ncbi:MAG: O-antigen ligase family protein [Bacteroidetes bacterium]|nr:O-antigen ligase family protein [Bacteroidota bacterium]